MIISSFFCSRLTKWLVSKTSLCLFLLVLLNRSAAKAQEQQIHPQSAKYEWPTDQAVKDKLDQWRDQKFGMIIHWGLYAVPGMIE
jgi:alpha-L-fucosidase